MKPLTSLTCVLATIAVPALSSPPVRDGVYKHLNYVAEAGDLLGMAVQIVSDRNPKIIVTTCEGGCFGGKAWPLRIAGDTISFTVCDNLQDQDGKPARCNPIGYVGRFTASGALAISIPGQRDSRLTLRRVVRPKPGEVEKLACAGNRC